MYLQRLAKQGQINVADSVDLLQTTGMLVGASIASQLSPNIARGTRSYLQVFPARRWGQIQSMEGAC